MELIWTAFLLGLLGSLHCAGMCGPLALAIPAAGNDPARRFIGRLFYNAGRITTYCAIGALFGLAGKVLVLAGLQRWLSLGAGLAILIGLAASTRLAAKTPLWRAVGWIKGAFRSLLHRPSRSAQFALGAVNGLLPCGLVYIAAAGAVATGGVVKGMAYMAAFGLGTAPMMLGIGMFGGRLQMAMRFRLQRFVPLSVLAVGLLLVVRGMSLGIPYLSPKLAPAADTTVSCH